MIPSEYDRLADAAERIRRSIRLARLPASIERIGKTVRSVSTRFYVPLPKEQALSDAVIAIRMEILRRRRKQNVLGISKSAETIRVALAKTFSLTEQKRFGRFIDAYRETGLPVAALSVCGRGTQEIRFTKLLRYYFDPKMPHGLGFRLLESVFGDKIEQRIDWASARVFSEYYLAESTVGERQHHSVVDLFVRIPSNNVTIMIEQKITSNEGVDGEVESVSQLRRYSEAFEILQSRNSDFIGPCYKFFLTPDEKAPRDDDSWRTLSHSHIYNRFIAIAGDRNLSQTARHNVAALLWDLAMGPLASESSNLPGVISRLNEVLKHPWRYGAWRKWQEYNVPFFPQLLNLMEACDG